MITKPMDVLAQYRIRKSKKQKAAFRDDVQAYLERLGYQVTVQKGDFGARNIIAGDNEKAKFLVTAHYDTPAGLPFPNLVTPVHVLPFVLWQTVMTVVLLAIPVLFVFLVNMIYPDSGMNWSLIYWVFFAEALLMMIGPANKNNANDNTSGVVSVLDIAANIPEDQRNKVCFVLFDFEEAGLIGSASYAGKYSSIAKQQIVLNLDCVGDGDDIMFFPTAKLKKDDVRMAWLNQAECVRGDKFISVRRKGFAYYPSDQANFKFGVGVAAMKKANNGWLYCDKIHTKHDVNLDENNVQVLSELLIDMIKHDDMLPAVVKSTKKPKLYGWKLFLVVWGGCAIFGMILGAILAVCLP